MITDAYRYLRPELRTAIAGAIVLLAKADDGGRRRDGAGFARQHRARGLVLARRLDTAPEGLEDDYQAAYKIVRGYRRQVEASFPELWTVPPPEAWWT